MPSDAGHALARAPQQDAAPAKELAPVPIRDGVFAVDNHRQLYQIAQYYVASNMAPKGLQTPEACFIAMAKGMSLGLDPMQSLESIAVINGRASIYGDTALAICRASGELLGFKETIEGQGDDMVAVCAVKRRNLVDPGSPFEVEERFGIADAKAAGLLPAASGPWKQYPKRMLRFRARGFALRDSFGDYLKGMRTAEEAMDIPEEPILEAEIVTKPGEGSIASWGQPTTAPPASDAPPGPAPGGEAGDPGAGEGEGTDGHAGEPPTPPTEPPPPAPNKKGRKPTKPAPETPDDAPPPVDPGEPLPPEEPPPLDVLMDDAINSWMDKSPSGDREKAEKGVKRWIRLVYKHSKPSEQSVKACLNALKSGNVNFEHMES